MEEGLKKMFQKMIEGSKNAYIASVNQDGYPAVKAMFALDRDSFHTFYFSTNTSSRRVAQFLQNPKASVYFCNEDAFLGLLLTGKMEVCRDEVLRRRLWHEGDEKYYPKGIDDEDYSVLKFTAREGNCYHNLEHFTFDVAELA